MTALSTTARLLKAVYRFRRQRDLARALGLPIPFRRRRKAALVARLQRNWPGGYAVSVAGDLVFLPQPLEFQALRILFGGPGAHPAALGFLPAGGIALDIGANLGEWTLPLAKAAGAEGRVLAFEPNPAIAQALGRSLRINNLVQAAVVEVALSDRDGTAELRPDRENSGATRLAAAAEGGKTVTVRTCRLDRLAAEAGLGRLDLVKIDVEGHERRVLEGAMVTLDRFHPALVLESAHESAEDRAAIADLLARLGYAPAAALCDGGALPASLDDYRARRGACAGSEAHDLLWLPRRRA